VLIALAVAGILLASACVGAVFALEKKDRLPIDADVIIVLGARVMPDGELSTTLEFRIQTAYEVYARGYAKNLILCGARGKDEPATEAQAMKEYLLNKGVPTENIFMEDQSFNTMQNLINAKGIMEAQGFETALLVTSNYHVERAVRLCEDAGIRASGVNAPGPLYWHNRMKARLRESMSWAYYLVFGWSRET
jgi:vancomycin permeability regulator SanA